MANQPKKYKKFVATAATATLVASAIVPVASAAPTDIENSEFQPEILKAIELELFQDNAKFNPSGSLTRGHVVLILGRYLEKQGFEPAEDYATNPAFSDLKVGANDEYLKTASIVKEAGVFTGTAGKINWNNNITREAIAIVLDRLSKEVTGTSLVEAAEEIEDVKVGDLDKAMSSYRAAIQALRDLEISTATNYNPKGELKRGQFAKFIVNALEAIENIEKPIDDKVDYGKIEKEITDAVSALATVEVTTANVAEVEAKYNEVSKKVAEAEAIVADAKDLTDAEKASYKLKFDFAKQVLAGVKAKIDAVKPEEQPEPPKETTPDAVTVASVSAINNTVTVGAKYTLPTVVTATMSDDSTKELAVTWNGTIDTSVAGTQTLEGTVEGFEGKAELTVLVKYANTGIAGFAFEGSAASTQALKAVAAEGASIFVNGVKQAQTVQANGAFNLETNPAAVEVKVKKDGFFAKKIDTAVAQNETAAVVAELTAVTPNTLEINGTVKGATGANLAGATVELYDATGTTKLATAVTSATGTYKFGNKGLTYVEAGTDDPSTANFFKKNAAGVNEAYNALAIDTKYVVKISKPLASDNVNDVYKELVTSVTTSDEQAITNAQTRLTTDQQVKEIKTAEVTVAWEEGVTATADAKVTIFTEVGKTLLSKEQALVTTSSNVAFDAIAGSTTTKKLNVLDSGILGSDATLPTGKYYVLIEDGNAATVFVMNVTEGQEVKGSTVTIKKAASYAVNSTVGDIVYNDALLENTEVSGSANVLSVGDAVTQINAGKVDTTTAISRATDTVDASYKLYQVVDGVKIPLGAASTPATYEMVSASTASVNTVLSANVAKGNTYAVTSVSPFTISSNAITKVIDSESSTSIVEAKSAATITPNVTFDTAANGRGTAFPATPAADKDVTVKLLAKDGSVVSTATLAELALNTQKADAFTSVRPGEYRLEVSAPGYETKTLKADEAVRVLDFQNQVIDIELKALAPVKLTGSVTKADGSTLDSIADAEASVAVYEVGTNGALSFVTGTDIEVSTSSDFNIVDVLEVGKKYRVITRGAGFETTVKDVTIKAGVNVLDFKVAKGGNASATLTITDTKNNKFTANPGAFLLDEKFVGLNFYTAAGTPIVSTDSTPVASDTDGNGVVSATEQAAFLTKLANGVISYTAQGFDLTYTGINTVAQDSTDGKIFTVAGLSTGTHTLVVPGTATASGVTSYFYSKPSVKINYVGAKLVSAVTVDIPTIQDGVIAYTVSGKVSGITSGTDKDEVIIAAYQGDKLVDYISATHIDANGDYEYALQLPNGKYTIKAFANGELVGSNNDVAIQNNHVSGKNIATTDAN